MSDLRPFDPAAPLPSGVTLLEASAGTGKTYTIANLAVRYLAEGTPIERLLVVTFTRSATGELRERVRDRLVATHAGLAEPAAAGGDALVALLAKGRPEDVDLRRRRLAAALADFDAATISTIHGFCEQVLTGLGTAADAGRDLRFSEEDGPLVDEVVDDLYLRKFRASGRPAFSRSDARQVVAVAVANRDAHLEPSQASRDTVEGLRASLARRGRDEVLRRARASGTIGWDDLVARLASTLHGPAGEVAIRRLRARYSVVLVDEFQDTDQQQWDIFRTAFAGGGIPLLLIGDPKQAIYSFRGADVWTYLSAAGEARNVWTLGVNWRSDQPLLDALDAVMAGATLGHPGIPYRTVTAAAGHEASRLRGAPSGAPLRLKLVHRGDGLVELTTKGWAQVDSARAVVATDLAEDIAALVCSGATIPGRSGERPVSCGDVAVLVRANHEAVTVHRALERAGVPAVIAGGGSVFATPAALHWLTLLEALEQPAASTRARAAALTPFIGWGAEALVAAPDPELDALQATLHRWAAVLAESGVATLQESMAVERELVARELAVAGGERRLTDLRHIGELLHAEAMASGAGGRALTAWLRDRIAEAGSDAAAEERSRRLDSDAMAVQIQTVHRSKGLEYPIVYLPYLWNAYQDRDAMPIYHDPDAGDRRTIDVGGERPDDWSRHSARAAEERRGEDVRQAYVAFTRARHQVVAWWATGVETKNAPLARFLLGRGPDGSLSHRPAAMPGDDGAVEARMLEVAARAGGTISVERVGPAQGRTYRRPGEAHPALDVDRFTRALDTDWRRASYTGITAAAHGAAPSPVVGSEAERPAVADEPGGGLLEGPPAPEAVPSEAVPSLASPMAGLPAGAVFGITVHEVLEAVDFAAPDLAAQLAVRAADVTRRRGDGAPAPAAGELASALGAVLTTPLGPLAGGRSLRQVDRRHRLDELTFELPLVGGDTPRAALSVADVAACLQRHIDPAGPLGGYPARLADPALDQVLRGYLTGSIDLALRVPSAVGDRYVVVDYKTNWLGPRGEALTTAHYQPARLAEAMVAEHYPLQAALYSVALHRYLRWRLAGYDPARHLGGVLYLFLRGMAGPATPVLDGQPCGVFAWEPPAGMVVELSDLLDRGATPDGTPRPGAAP